jgi:hypothetical protein
LISKVRRRPLIPAEIELATYSGKPSGEGHTGQAVNVVDGMLLGSSGDAFGERAELNFGPRGIRVGNEEFDYG